MPGEALELLPHAALQGIVGRHISPDHARADRAASKRTLLEDAKALDAAACADYQSFQPGHRQLTADEDAR